MHSHFTVRQSHIGLMYAGTKSCMDKGILFSPKVLTIPLQESSDKEHIVLTVTGLLRQGTHYVNHYRTPQTRSTSSPKHTLLCIAHGSDTSVQLISPLPFKQNSVLLFFKFWCVCVCACGADY